ncbi:unnamed protein product, partial [Polarella glacialis]
ANAEAAGATAFLIYDTADPTVIELLALSGSSRKLNIPGFMISKAQGQALASRLQAAEALKVYCQWKPVKVWFDMPASSNMTNDTLQISNHGDANMYWLPQVRRWFAPTDKIYEASVGPSPPPFSGATIFPLLYDGSVVARNGASRISLPFTFPLYLTFFQQAWVSTNGAIVLDPNFVAGSDSSATLGVTDGANAVVAGLWDNLVCSFCEITTKEPLTGGDGVGVTAVRYENMSFYKSGAVNNAGDGPLTFEVWLYQDGRVLVNVLVFPASAASRSSLQMGLE